LQHIQTDRRSGVSSKLFLNLLIQFYLNNVANLHQLASHALQHWDRIVNIDYCDDTSPCVLIIIIIIKPICNAPDASLNDPEARTTLRNVTVRVDR